MKNLYNVLVKLLQNMQIAEIMMFLSVFMIFTTKNFESPTPPKN